MKKYIVTVNGKKYEVEVEETGSPAAPAAQAYAAPIQQAPPAPAVEGEQVKAPMPGTILDIKISKGQSVKKGDVLFILEAMKMENEIMAGRDGEVASVNTAKGSIVNTGDILAVLK